MNDNYLAKEYQEKSIEHFLLWHRKYIEVDFVYIFYPFQFAYDIINWTTCVLQWNKTI